MDTFSFNDKPLLDLATLGSLREIYSTPEELKEIVDLFVADAKKNIHEISVSFNDADALRHAAHSLKGSSSVIGAIRLAEVSFQIEICGRNNQLQNVPSFYQYLKPIYEETMTILLKEVEK
ncbi:MAG: Hpt domain-containing protein [Chloroherpetonaceae bacterium]|nr:Hpt domain-containing protein [Chloroherpetonaceae bacterium]